MMDKNDTANSQFNRESMIKELRKQVISRLCSELYFFSRNMFDEEDTASKKREIAERIKAGHPEEPYYYIDCSENNIKVIKSCMKEILEIIEFLTNSRNPVEEWQLVGMNAMLEKCNECRIIPYDLPTSIKGLLCMDIDDQKEIKESQFVSDCEPMREDKEETEKLAYISIEERGKCRKVAEAFRELYQTEDMVVLNAGRFGFVKLRYYRYPGGFENVFTFTNSEDLFEDLWEEWLNIQLLSWAEGTSMIEMTYEEIWNLLPDEKKKEFEDKKRQFYKKSGFSTDTLDNGTRKYCIAVMETLQRIVVVEQESLDKAIEYVRNAYDAQKIILGADDLIPDSISGEMAVIMEADWISPEDMEYMEISQLDI